MHDSNFSIRLAEAMASRGLTQLQLGERMDRAQTTISRWLSGAVPRKSAAVALAKALGVSMEWLMEGCGEMGYVAVSPQEPTLDPISSVFLKYDRNLPEETVKEFFKVVATSIKLERGDILECMRLINEYEPIEAHERVLVLKSLARVFVEMLESGSL